MPQIETWSRLPAAVRAHLVERMHDRKISLEDLNQLRLWMEAKPQVPEGAWYTRTIRANLRHYQPQHRTVVPETLVGHTRHTKSRAQLDHVILCVDQSGSMATSVVYSSIFAAVMASIPGLSPKLICFDTSIVDLTDQLADPVEVLFGV